MTKPGPPAVDSADQIDTIALPVLYVSRYGGDASATNILAIAAALPMMLFSLATGDLTDRSALRSIVYRRELVRLAFILALIFFGTPALLAGPSVLFPERAACLFGPCSTCVKKLLSFR